MRILLFIICLTLFACIEKHPASSNQTISQAIPPSTTSLRSEALKIIRDAYFATLITLDNNGIPKARIMEPFPPEADFTIWLATNPRSRKVREINNCPIITLHYFDKKRLGYVSLYGRASLVNDADTKSKIWKDGWEKFYPDKDKDYLLIRFVPDSLELISITDNYTGNKNTWQPHVLRF